MDFKIIGVIVVLALIGAYFVFFPGTSDIDSINQVFSKNGFNVYPFEEQTPFVNADLSVLRSLATDLEAVKVSSPEGKDFLELSKNYVAFFVLQKEILVLNDRLFSNSDFCNNKTDWNKINSNFSDIFILVQKVNSNVTKFKENYPEVSKDVGFTGTNSFKFDGGLAANRKTLNDAYEVACNA